ncbi:recombinase family protein [Schinkia azotoformans]|uniref:recombinase family protein n=1 Tax=Schinkia azotoformans TaxID=1454 RepID=UPI002DB94EF5|nr:recombinase family protein [Schinkia azotoformans]MEC1717802.1 recombinase family protein [Schinkia azotoformans]MEC1743566.1 recombinase family protein [Schinkia azotoformans]MEC1746560.1 recombinase family protein [Schinkia azotoformans]MEC1757796.1 recombinase family protein [Schinkia azotoformans]MEC1769309.1 recombinase family protein [Schinkia azotoformans]
MSNKLFGYARVSTLDQNLDRQIDILKEYGVQEEDIYTDKISGAKFHRPALDELQKILRPGDTVITESLSRLSRSTKDLLTILNDWQERDIIFISIKEQFDLSSSAGKLMLTILAGLGEFERDVIRERVKEGLESARARGRVGGRPKTDKKVLEKAIKLYDAKTHSILEITEITGVSQSVLYRALHERKRGD